MPGELEAQAVEVVRLRWFVGLRLRFGSEVSNADAEGLGERVQDGQPLDGLDTALDL
jgi:hypothetical protein